MPSKTKTVQTTQNSTTQNAPWEPQQGRLTAGWDVAADLLGRMPDVSSAANYAQRAGLSSANSGRLFQEAAADPRLSQASYNVANVANNGGLDANAQGILQNVAASGGLNGTAQDYFTRAARGDYLTQNNPFFQDMVNNSIMAARPSLDAAFASSGRFGSGAYANAFSDAATRRATELGYADYGRERGFQNSAATALNQFGLQDAGLRAQTAGSLNQFGLQDAGLRVNASQALPGLLAAPANLEGQGAQAFARASDSDRASATMQNDSNWQNLLRYVQAIGSPIPGTVTSQSVGTQPVQQANPWTQAAGLVIGGLGAGRSLGNLGSLFGGGSASPAGGANLASDAAAGFGQGASVEGMMAAYASALPAMSDARAKDDIKRVGQLDNGLPVYSYRYKGQPTTQIGLMAQDVAQVKPHAIADMGNGLMGVRYAHAVT